MIIRKIDGTGDWTFGKGIASYATDEAAIEQNIKTRLLSWVGDSFFALTEGVDWRNRLDVGQQANLVAEVKAYILRSFGVVGILNFTPVFNSAGRLESVTYTIQTIFSTSFQRTLSLAAGLGN